ncbi:hypothetical protein CBS101457_005565 [Exobasidium rhododendri]|nr:hypothetical protein CBS101457_005565 [Exobasidium rhododendri]
MQEDQHPINLKGWMDVYPAPLQRSEHPLAQVSVEELDSLRSSSAISGHDYLVVDVRRADCLSMIPGAINLPAQSLCASMPTLMRVLSSVPLVIFHCGRSNGRGPRAAGWYADALQSHLGLDDKDVAQRVRILTGGIVAWEASFGQGSLQHRGERDHNKTVQL